MKKNEMPSVMTKFRNKSPGISYNDLREIQIFRLTDYT